MNFHFAYAATMPITLQPERLLSATTESPDTVAVRDSTTEYTWQDLEFRARRLANGLRIDVGTGSWGMLSANRVEWAEAALATVRAGCRLVPLNWHLSEQELADLVRDSSIRLIVADASHAGVARHAAAIATSAGADPVRVIELGDEYEGWVGSQPNQILPDGAAGVTLQYTGGTTGPSRAVIRADAAGTVRDFSMRQRVWGDLTGMPESGVALLVTPAYHALGGALMRSSLVRGIPITMLEHWDPQKVLDTIESQRITVTAMVPTQLIRLLKLTSAERYQVDTSSLEWVLHTAAPCPEWVKRGMIDWFGPVIVELYGSSEGAGPVVCTTQEWLDHPGTVGRAVGSLRLSILDDEGNDLPAGQVGAIFAARADGPPTYFGDEEKTAAIRLPDGRFTVGDIGWLDDDEFLYLADRRVDLVIRGGANVYPAEIEGVISEHHCVADVAVFGVDDPEWGQQIVALVELVASSAPPTDAATTIEDLFEHCRQRLSSFKVPQVLDIMEKLPREASGKLKKRIVREEYLLRQSVADG